MINPFPRPDPSEEETQEIISWINSRINSQKGLKFHDCLEQIEKLIRQKKQKMARIAAYYATNILINNKSMSDNEKADIIMGLKSQVNIC